MSTTSNLQAPQEPKRRKLIPEMEGYSARRYAKLRGTEPQLRACRLEASRLAETLNPGSRILEVAPGPGYLAIELAKVDRFRVTGLDVSRTFVSLAGDFAGRAGVTIDFQLGDAAAMPFPSAQFDLVVCQAAFKNFDRPVAALNEMHRVLRPGGRAIIQDMSGEATAAAIAAEVAGMNVGLVTRVTTRLILTGLRRRAYSPAQFEQLSKRSRFGDAVVGTQGIGFEATLTARAS
jgi:ubiquinone/menaquinone biosynthesis C-methylase UbiE